MGMETPPASEREQQIGQLKANIAAIQNQLAEDAEGGRHMDEQERSEAERSLELYESQLDEIERAN